MGLVRRIRTSRSRSAARGRRELARAFSSAPTRASREELLHLAGQIR